MLPLYFTKFTFKFVANLKKCKQKCLSRTKRTWMKEVDWYMIRGSSVCVVRRHWSVIGQHTHTHTHDWSADCGYQCSATNEAGSLTDATAARQSTWSYDEVGTTWLVTTLWVSQIVQRSGWTTVTRTNFTALLTIHLVTAMVRAESHLVVKFRFNSKLSLRRRLSTVATVACHRASQRSLSWWHTSPHCITSPLYTYCTHHILLLQHASASSHLITWLATRHHCYKWMPEVCWSLCTKHFRSPDLDYFNSL